MFQQITEHIYVYPREGSTDRPNIGLIVGDRYTLLFDAGNSAEHVAQMRQALEKQGLPQPDGVVLSHFHWDHCYGAEAWGVPVLAGRETNARLVEASKWGWTDEAMEQRVQQGLEIRFCTDMIKREYPDRSRIRVIPADVVFDGNLSLNLGGGVRVELLHCKGPHSSDSVICHVPGDRFLFLGDSEGKDLYGYPWEFDINQPNSFRINTAAIPYDKEKVDRYLELLDALDFTRCIGGHAPVKSRQTLYEQLTLPQTDV